MLLLPLSFYPRRTFSKLKTGDMSIGNGILKYFPFIFLCVLLTSGMPTQFPHVNPTSPSMMIPATSTLAPSWCVANAAASQVALQVGLDYACGYGGSDCLAIQPGGSCYEPNTVADHASYAFNEYYQKNPAPTSCVFGGTSRLTSIDPSHNSCRYALPRTLSSTSSTVIPTPMATQMPAGATIYGSESAAKSSSTALEPNYYILLPTMVTLLPLIFIIKAKLCL